MDGIVSEHRDEIAETVEIKGKSDVSTLLLVKLSSRASSVALASVLKLHFGTTPSLSEGMWRATASSTLEDAP